MPKSLVLVLIQFAAITYFLVFDGWLAPFGIWRIVELIGIGVGVWAIAVMNPMKVSIFPEPRNDGELHTSGPYRWVRHPMYTAVLLVCGAIAAGNGSWLDGIVFSILLINQWIKLRHEESLLTLRYDGYAAYMKKTKALIPYFL